MLQEALTWLLTDARSLVPHWGAGIALAVPSPHICADCRALLSLWLRPSNMGPARYNLDQAAAADVLVAPSAA